MKLNIHISKIDVLPLAMQGFNTFLKDNLRSYPITYNSGLGFMYTRTKAGFSIKEIKNIPGTNKWIDFDTTGISING